MKDGHDYCNASQGSKAMSQREGVHTRGLVEKNCPKLCSYMDINAEVNNWRSKDNKIPLAVVELMFDDMIEAGSYLTFILLRN